MKRRLFSLNIVFIFIFALLATCCLPQFAAAKTHQSACCHKSQKADSNSSHCDGHCLRAIHEGPTVMSSISLSTQYIFSTTVSTPVLLVSNNFRYTWKAPPDGLSPTSLQHRILRI